MVNKENNKIIETSNLINRFILFFTDLKSFIPFILSFIYITNYFLEYYFFTKENISFSFIEFSWQNFVQNTLVIFLTLFCSICITIFLKQVISSNFFNLVVVVFGVLVLIITVLKLFNNYFQDYFFNNNINFLNIFFGCLLITYVLKGGKKFFLILAGVNILTGIIFLQFQFLEKQNYYYLSYKTNGESSICRVFRIYNSRVICTNSNISSVNDFNKNYSINNDSSANSFSVLDLNKIEEVNFIPFSNGQIDTIRVFNLINKHRADNNLQPLKVNNLLNKAAQQKSEDMVKNKYFSHESPNGVKWTTFIKNVNYDFLVAGENLATGFLSADLLVEAWMQSPSHKDNILNTKIEEFGMASVNSYKEPNKITMYFAKSGSIK